MTREGVTLGRISERSAGAHSLGLQSLTTGGRTFSVRAAGGAKDDVFDLVDVTDSPVTVMRLTGRHWAGRKNSVLHLTDERWFRFPISGLNPGSSVMTAIDERGTKVAHFRRQKSAIGSRAHLLQHKIEVVLNPDHQLTRECIAMIAMASGFTVTWYARIPGGGDG